MQLSPSLELLEDVALIASIGAEKGGGGCGGHKGGGTGVEGEGGKGEGGGEALIAASQQEGRIRQEESDAIKATDEMIQEQKQQSATHAAAIAQTSARLQTVSESEEEKKEELAKQVTTASAAASNPFGNQRGTAPSTNPSLRNNPARVAESASDKVGSADLDKQTSQAKQEDEGGIGLSFFLGLIWYFTLDCAAVVMPLLQLRLPLPLPFQRRLPPPPATQGKGQRGHGLLAALKSLKDTGAPEAHTGGKQHFERRAKNATPVSYPEVTRALQGKRWEAPLAPTELQRTEAQEQGGGNGSDSAEQKHPDRSQVALLLQAYLQTSDSPEPGLGALKWCVGLLAFAYLVVVLSLVGCSS